MAATECDMFLVLGGAAAERNKKEPKHAFTYYSAILTKPIGIDGRFAGQQMRAAYAARFLLF